MRVCVPPPDGHARIVFILAALAALPLDAQQDPPTVRAVLGGTLIDGTGAPPVPGATVVIEGERIVCAGPAPACPVPDGARTVDATGRWVIPGLIDTHVHLFWRPEPRGEEWGHGRNGDALRRRLSPMAVLQAATLNSARALGWDDRIGTIEPGKLADLVILDADPLEDIDNARRVWRVMKGGIVYDPEQVVPRGGGDG